MCSIELSLRYFEKDTKASHRNMCIVGFHLCKMDTEYAVLYAFVCACVFQHTESLPEVNVLHFIMVI